MNSVFDEMNLLKEVPTPNSFRSEMGDPWAIKTTWTRETIQYAPKEVQDLFKGFL